MNFCIKVSKESTVSNKYESKVNMSFKNIGLNNKSLECVKVMISSKNIKVLVEIKTRNKTFFTSISLYFYKYKFCKYNLSIFIN